ncbi:MAG: hypothetical protein WCY11_02370 [Novosphingobium sp.]
MTAVAIAALLIGIGPLIGFLTARKQRSHQGHAESELRFGPLITGLSAASAGNSAFILIGAVGLGYMMGLRALWIPLSYWVGDIIFWYFIAHRLVRRVQSTGVDTISELIAHQTKGQSSLPLRVAAIVTILAVSLFCMAQLLAIGKISSEFLGLPFGATITGAVLICLASVCLGGLGSSMLVNVYQSFLMLVSAVLLLLYVAHAVMTAPAALSDTPLHEQLLNPFYGFSTISLSLLILAFILSGLLYTTCSPHVLSRITKGNVDEIPRLRWIYMGFTQSLWQLMTLVGVALALLGTHAPDPDSAGVIYAQSVMPALLLGLFFAGIVAASTSTAEAQILVIANSLAMDIAPAAFLKLGNKARSRLLILLRILVALGLYVALRTADLDTVSSLVIQSGTILFAAFGVPAAMFIFRRITSGPHMTLIIMAGGGATYLTRLHTDWPPGHEIFPGLAAAGLVLALGLLLRRSATESTGH